MENNYLTWYVYASLTVATTYLICTLPLLFQDDGDFSISQRVVAASLMWHMLLVSWPLTMSKNLFQYGQKLKSSL